MTSKEKDQAIYNEMLRIANEVFDKATKNSEKLRKYMLENGGVVTNAELQKQNSDIFRAIQEATHDEETYSVNVDTFSCSFPAIKVFYLINYWKQILKDKEQVVFCYEEEITNEYIGSVDISLDNPQNAKCLANHLVDDKLRPILNYVLLEVNTKSCDVNFVATDGHSMSIISNNAERIRMNDYPENKYQALFSSSDWKHICDYARKNKTSIKFKIYKRSETEMQDTMVASLGETAIRSIIFEMYYPNWRSVIPDTSEMKLFRLLPDDVKAAQKFVKNIKSACLDKDVCLTFKQGSDEVCFTHIDGYYDDMEEKSASFRLVSPAETTMQIVYKANLLQRIKFTGFFLKSEDRATIICDDNSDITLLMPTESTRYHHLVEVEQIQAA